ncbi:MAG: cytochrome c oxidase subunit II [Gemmatimonadetes bacterium]|nr:cytochrome c oxidase subunit II [Gemmatimonadota bacterium]
MAAVRLVAPTLLLTAAAASCSSPQNVLDPHGPAAMRIEELWWVLFVMGVTVSIVVAALLLLAIRRGRQRERGTQGREINGHYLVSIGAGLITPAVIFALAIYSYVIGAGVYPPVDEDAGALTVEVTGHQFWWEVRYPQYDLVSANEVVIPVGRRVRFLVTSRDVIHSFWVPQLQGKIDMIPGHTTRQWLQADEPGRYRGQCAEFCGASHALMALWVFAVPEEEFGAWLDARRQPALEPADPDVREGRAVFVAAECHLCHATRGVARPEALGDAGPDLTHLATRETLAAGTLPNTRGNLTAWISDPERIKPGARMPPTVFPPDQLRALLDYLQSLR